MIALATIIERFEADCLTRYAHALLPNHRQALPAVLPKGLRRARNHGFLHPNSKRLIALLQLLVFRAPPAGIPPTQHDRPLPLIRPSLQTVVAAAATDTGISDRVRSLARSSAAQMLSALPSPQLRAGLAQQPVQIVASTI